jgi:di/tripeptidase
VSVPASVLDGVEPGGLWRQFEKLTTIARPSRQEEHVIEHVRRHASALHDVVETLEAVARLAGGRLELVQEDPGWLPRLDSPLLRTAQGVYERLFGSPPIVTAVHAWLETAVIGDRVRGLDMISFGRARAA